ncbi:hypothetical protein ABET11_27535 [Priestia megaterium]|uniref:hypothetical protein n=2 Tax=Priestia megaterium TaxID=1404 RepID=UPI000BF53B97|nr:hypothetical protein [Priestia megaterium]MED3872583.1 hypothetical protein [Priestia megaterium]MED4619599.1 hypothetical protein [Priestia megaterium]PER75468.1 hypothetical protein CN492_12570 [Priestia megaterium]PEU55277.1 hypothetical protein CN395_24940 [Priestia megaterium]PEW13224.1 hypothetical protein CN435_23680 [Priestia megaterium]
METKCHMIILEKETDQYIQDYIARHKLRFPREAIMNICQKYREEKKKEWSLDTITEAVSENLRDVLRDELKKLRLGASSVDKNTEILIEFINGLYFYPNYHGIMTTNLQEVGVTKIAEEVVEERILKQRQQQLGKEYSKRKSSLLFLFN